MNRMMTVAGLFAWSLMFTMALPVQAQTDWPYWVGPTYTGISGEKNLPAEWNPKGGEGSNVLWRSFIGSRSTPTIMNGKIYLLSHANEDDITRVGERVVCLDTQTGEMVWDHPFNVYLSDVPVERVGWSSVVCDPDSGNVYALGVCGYFCCLNGETGDLIWEHSMAEEFGFLTTYGGRTNYPLVHENNVIVSAVVIGWGDQAKPCHRFLAMDKTNGQPVWFTGTRPLPYDTTYSAPVLGVINGELQMVFASGDGGIHAFQPRTGKPIWKYNLSGHGINTTPLIVGNRVYCGHSEENLDSTAMGGLVCLDATKTGDITKDGAIWKRTELAVGRSSPIMIEGRLYATDDRAKMHCLNPDTGEELGEPVRLGTMMRANLLYADGKIYAHEVNGRGYVLKPTETGAEILERFRFPSGEECYGSPIAYDGKIYVPTTGGMYCVGFPDNDAQADPLPEMAKEPPVSEDKTPAELQLVPVESLLSPGVQQFMDVRLYNANGQYLRNATAEEVALSVDGVGTADVQPFPGSDRKVHRFQIPEDSQGHATAILTAKVGELSGQARVRDVPDLNWSFNFDDGQIPETWIGCAYRHIPLDWDLLSKLRQEDPLAGELYLYFMTEFTNSTAEPVFDNSTPQLRWKKLVEYIGVADTPEEPRTIDDAKAKFDPALQRLVDEKVVGSFEWTPWKRETAAESATPEIRLSVKQGERKIDGNGVLCKISTIPLGTRSQGWMGPADLHDYTIQSDVLCFSQNGKLPDAGMIAQRYTIDMMGAFQLLQLRTWTPQLNRFSQNADFEWKPDVWYTLKFRAAVEDGKAVLKGKVWPRDQEEPEDWTVVAEDAVPNVQGSPGLFGNSGDGEIFYDNLTVTRNQE